MNMDEVQKSSCTMEESDPMASTMAIATVSGEVGRANDEGNGSTASENGGGVALIRQRSLVKQPSDDLSIPRTLSGKTLEELWEDPITTDPTLASSGSGGDLSILRTLSGKTLEELWENPMTTDPILASSGSGDAGANVGNFAGPGVGNGGMLPNMNSNGGYNGMASALAPQLGQMGMPICAGPTGLALGANFPAQSPASDGMVSSHGNERSLQSPVDNSGVDGSKREEGERADGSVDEVEERRQRRMISNRESAARSRARKKALIANLETEVTRLKEENNELVANFEAEVTRLKEENNRPIANSEAEVTRLKEENNRLRKKIIEEMDSK